MTDDWVPPPVEPPLPPPLRLDGLTLSYGDEQTVAIQVEDGLLNLRMKHDDPEGELRFDFARLLLQTGSWHAVLGTGAQDHFINLRVRVSQQPPDDERGWQAQDEVVLEGAEAYLAVESLYRHEYVRWALPEDGPWALRTRCRGRDRGRTTDGTAFTPEDREEWLLDLWPARR